MEVLVAVNISTSILLLVAIIPTLADVYTGTTGGGNTVFVGSVALAVS